MNRRFKIAIIVLLIGITKISGQGVNVSEVKVLNVYGEFSELKEVPISRFINKVTFVQLEDNPQSLISDNGANYEVTDKFIIVKQFTAEKYQILLFNRETGKFICQIGNNGRGPGEFSAWSYLPYNHAKKEIYALDYSRNIIVYNLSGKIIDIINTPFLPDPEIATIGNKSELYSKRFIQYYEILDKDVFVGYFQNFSGVETRKILLLAGGRVLKIFPNYLRWDKEKGNGFIYPPGGFAKFYKWDNKVNFLEVFCDTLYEVTKDKLVPRYYFDSGPFKAEYAKQAEVALKWYNYFYLVDIKENHNYIFIQFSLKRERYLGVIEKNKNSLTICKIGTTGDSSLIDDVCGLMGIIPDHFTQNNEMVYIIQPMKLISWLKENPEKSAQAFSRHLWLKSINEFSNPVIAIGSCKD